MEQEKPKSDGSILDLTPEDFAWFDERSEQAKEDERRKEKGLVARTVKDRREKTRRKFGLH